MAHGATLYAKPAAVGAKDGTSAADAAGIDSGAADDILTIVNGDVPAAGGTAIKLLADSPVTVTAAFAVTQDAAQADRFVLQGRDLADSADTEVTLDADNAAFPVISLVTADYWNLRHIHASNTDENAGNDGFIVGADADYVSMFECRASNCYRGVDASAALRTRLLRFRGHDNADYGVFLNTTSGYASESVAHDNGDHGFLGGHLVGCLAYLNADGCFVVSAVGCTAYLNSGDGFSANNATNVVAFIDCIAEGNGGYGYKADAATVAILLLRCADFNNTSGRSNAGVQGTWWDEDPVVLTASPFVNPGGGVFDLNNAPGGGADCREFGGIVLPGGLTTSYHDRGVAQHPPGSANPLHGKLG